MKVTGYGDVQGFLARTRRALESNEPANSLFLGICERLARQPEATDGTPCLWTVEDDKDVVLAALMTLPRKMVVYGHHGDLVGGARALVKELMGQGWQIPGVMGSTDAAAAVASSWTAVTGGSHVLETHLRAYALREVLTPAPERGRLRLATEEDIPLVSRWWAGFNLEIDGEGDLDAVTLHARERVAQGDVYLWDAGRLVSMAAKTRPTTRGISVGPVYTPPELRGRGYATACVGELSRLLLAQGRVFCALFADLTNGTANRIYQRIGYRPVCDYDEYSFGHAGDGEPRC